MQLQVPLIDRLSSRSPIPRLTLAISHSETGDLRSLRPTMRIPFNNRPSPPAPSHLYCSLSPLAEFPQFVRAIHDRLLRDSQIRVVDSHYQIMRQLYVRVYTVSESAGDSARKSGWQTRFRMSNVLSREPGSRFPNPFRFDRIRNR